ncbi:MAG: hypothetical protein H7323_00235 [Frankiales bacterium]|nr:hypothetical protein [Frankiales bacterium]
MFTLLLDAPSPGAARLRLQGHLDEVGAREVLQRAATMVHCGCDRLVVDLDGVTSFEADAAYAVVGCTRLARFLPLGVDVIAGEQAGRDLAEHAGVDDLLPH